MKRRPSYLIWMLGTTALILLSGATMAASAVVKEAGDTSSYASLIQIPQFSAYYWLLTAAFLVTGYLIVGSSISPRVLTIAGSIGVVPEGAYPLFVLRNISEEGFQNIDMTLSFVGLPGRILLWGLTGDTFNRWAVGVSDPPTKLIMMVISTIGCLNVLGWLLLFALILWTYQRWRA